MHLKNKRLGTKVIIVSLVIFIFAAGFGFMTVNLASGNSSVAANFADNILRPLIGNTATIKLETLLFNSQDVLKKATYISAQDINQNPDKPLVWETVASESGNNDWVLKEAKAYPDKERNYTYVNLVKMNSKNIALGSVAGIKEPASEVGNPGSGIIPAGIVKSGLLVAAFNGGFQYRDGQYGMYSNNKEYLPLRSGLATFSEDNNLNTNIFEYANSLDMGKYIFLRQNGPMLVKNGLVIPSSDDKLAKIWGRSVTSSMYTWRSGIGITKEGDLVYAAGPSLIPETLGLALKEAGSINAMQLDINPFWVRYVIFKNNGSGYYHESLFSKMFDGTNDFVKGDKKDFFYVYLKDSGIGKKSLHYSKYFSNTAQNFIGTAS